MSLIRYRPRVFDQVGHQTKSACIENKHFFLLHQTYQNYEQPPQSLQNLYFQSHFLASKIKRIFSIDAYMDFFIKKSMIHTWFDAQLDQKKSWTVSNVQCTSRNTVGLFRFSVPQFNRWQFKMMDFQTTGLNLSAKSPCSIYYVNIVHI